ncbi:Poly [ADP-ribose] polymerase 2 [Cichlidogyrus casuarinus]|uniref:Poly [ADP-ribose] polymerase n=1 Tax=Cichlidogyrus casuarinus TaxID=1844966 RepID=A0ABD2Q4L7_9PLAT
MFPKMTTEFSSLLEDYPILEARFKNCRSGKISEANPPNPFTWERIDEGLVILQELHNCDCSNRIKNLSNRFHVVIPYSGDTRDRPMIDTQADFTDSLHYLHECAELLSLAKEEFPHKIRCLLLPKDDPVVDVIKQFVTASSGPDHGFQIKVSAISELILAKPRLQGNNVRLLFHGTESAAILSIIKNGFYLPETNDGMFGKGVYFTDVSTKATQYSFSGNIHSDSGYLLLCEVDLGNMKETYEADKSELPKEYDSRACVGKYQPNMEGFKQLGNAKLPNGTQLVMQHPSSVLNYNEYVVYNTERIQPKYLLEITMV